MSTFARKDTPVFVLPLLNSKINTYGLAIESLNKENVPTDRNRTGIAFFVNETILKLRMALTIRLREHIIVNKNCCFS